MVIYIAVDPSSDINLAKELYYIAKSQLGVTDTFQGKQDSTATSGVAKRTQIEQAAGRMRSKQVMKKEAYRKLFKLIFLYQLAYCDEPRSYPNKNDNGVQEVVYFNKYDFLEQDEYGNWYWDIDYIFDVDESGVNTTNTEMMLVELKNNFASGTYGNPQDPETVLYYWEDVEVIGFPNARRNVNRWRKKVEEKQQMEELMQSQSQMASVPPQPNNTPPVL